MKACGHKKERNHLKEPWEIDANAEKDDGKKKHEKTFCLVTSYLQFEEHLTLTSIHI